MKHEPPNRDSVMKPLMLDGIASILGCSGGE